MQPILKPAWLDKKISLSACMQMRQALRDLQVETVCEQALCPNIGECFARHEATFLILGRRCTRQCSFCNIEKRTPAAPDLDEPRRIAQAVVRFGLLHVVVTSVTRDDLPDGGAQAFAQTILQIRAQAAHTTIEVLIPDFNFSSDALATVVAAEPDIIGHNVETVPSLYAQVRQGGSYERSLGVLRALKAQAPGIQTKSSIMVGLGERSADVYAVMRDLRAAGCDFVSIGQYLAPSRAHYPVQEYVALDQFAAYQKHAGELGFAHCQSGPYVRSSYRASAYRARTKECVP